MCFFFPFFPVPFPFSLLFHEKKKKNFYILFLYARCLSWNPVECRITFQPPSFWPFGANVFSLSDSIKKQAVSSIGRRARKLKLFPAERALLSSIRWNSAYHRCRQKRERQKQSPYPHGTRLAAVACCVARVSVACESYSARRSNLVSLSLPVRM